MEFNTEYEVMPGEIREAFDALETLKGLRSTKEKESVLTAHRGNSVLQALLWNAFNTFRQYYVKQFIMPEPFQGPVSADTYRHFMMLLNDLSNRRFSDPKSAVEQFLGTCSKEEQYWYACVIRRDLGLGITAKGVNKAWPGFIPIYDVQLAESVKDPTLSDKSTIARLPERYVLQYKIDGYRLNIHKNNGQVSICTRSGLPVEGYAALEEDAAALLPDGHVYDGEMVDPGLFSWIEQNMLKDDGIKVADRSLFREAVRKVFSHEENKQGVFNIFDAVKKSDWDSQSVTDPYARRLQFLGEAVSPVLAEGGSSQMTVVPTSRVFCKNNPDDIAETIRIFHKFLSWGWEGLMIKAVDAPYAWKRTKSLWKMKLMDTADLTVLGISESSDRGLLGALLCDYKGTALNIGTGSMSREMRRQFFADPNKIIGRTVEVAYQAESIGRNGEPVLDFARFKGIRKDK